MPTNFFRFLSRRGRKTPANPELNICNGASSSKDTSSCAKNPSNKHTKLNGCEDLKESIQHYNQRCQAIKQLKEREQQELNNNTAVNPNPYANQITNQAHINKSNNIFVSFKSFDKYKPSSDPQSPPQVPPTKDSIECAVFFLDDTHHSFFIPKKSPAKKLYEQVLYHLDLIETDYFGLQFSDTHNVRHWLDPSKPIKKQCKIGPPYQFFFRVKFYTAEPNNLKEELTRYFYFLQLKNDLRYGRLQCTQVVFLCRTLKFCFYSLVQRYSPYFFIKCS